MKFIVEFEEFTTDEDRGAANYLLSDFQDKCSDEGVQITYKEEKR